MEKNGNVKSQINPESLISKVKEFDSKKIYLISKEKIIEDIFTFLQQKNESISNKIIIIEYLNKCIGFISWNTEVLIRKKVNNKCLYHMIIYQYITNYENKQYSEALLKLFISIIRHTSYDREIYQYIISFISNYINKKALLLNDIGNIKMDNNYFEEEIDTNNFNSNHLKSILELIEESKLENILLIEYMREFVILKSSI